ncbi:HAD family phosphatase [Candidatus Woesearchaeota archaeon]|nr:HAD family phosphatase [Candidatus Woesearchaeota archaeon]
MVKGVIFDFDGVLVDSERKKFNDLRFILGEQGLRLGEDVFSVFIGKKTRSFLEHEFPTLVGSRLDAVLKRREIMQFQDLKKNKLIVGVRDLLRFLEMKKAVIMISTGSKRKFVEELLKVHKIRHYFSRIISGEDFSTSKPDPECFLVALRQMGLKPDYVIVIEDSAAGVAAAKAANIRVFAIKTYSKEAELSGANKIFNNALDLLDYIKKNYSNL